MNIARAEGETDTHFKMRNFVVNQMLSRMEWGVLAYTMEEEGDIDYVLVLIPGHRKDLKLKNMIDHTGFKEFDLISGESK